MNESLQQLTAYRRMCECGHWEGWHGGDGKWCLANIQPCDCEGFKEVPK